KILDLNAHMKIIEEYLDRSPPPSEAVILFTTGKFFFQLLKGNFSECVNFFPQLEKLARETNFTIVMIPSMSFLSQSLYYLNMKEKALQIARENVALYQQTNYITFAMTGFLLTDVL